MVIEIFENVYYSNPQLHGDQLPIMIHGDEKVGIAKILSYRMNDSGATVTMEINIPNFNPAWLGYTPWIRESYSSGRLLLGLTSVLNPDTGEHTLLEHFTESKLREFLK